MSENCLHALNENQNGSKNKCIEDKISGNIHDQMPSKEAGQYPFRCTKLGICVCQKRAARIQRSEHSLLRSNI